MNSNGSIVPLLYNCVIRKSKSLNSFTVILKSPSVMDYCQSKCIRLCMGVFCCFFKEHGDLVWT